MQLVNATYAFIFLLQVCLQIMPYLCISHLQKMKFQLNSTWLYLFISIKEIIVADFFTQLLQSRSICS